MKGGRKEGKGRKKERREEGLLPFPLSLPLFFPSFPGREEEEGKGRERGGEGREQTKPSQASKGQEGLWEGTSLRALWIWTQAQDQTDLGGTPSIHLTDMGPWAIQPVCT